MAEALPRARLLAKGRVSSNIAVNLPSIDVATESLTAQELNIGGTPGVARVLVDRPNRFEIETSSDGRQLLVLTSRYHPAWRAVVDGSSEKPIRFTEISWASSSKPARTTSRWNLRRPVSQPALN